MGRPFLLIDAHNAIFARPELAALHGRNPAAAREKLVHLLERHQDASGTRIVAVFDGRGSPVTVSEKSGSAGIQVFYPQSGQSADGILEKLVLKYAAVHHLTVASNDTLVRTATEAAGAVSMSIEMLFGEIARAEGEMNETLERHRRRR